MGFGGATAAERVPFRSFLRCASRFLANKSREVCARAAAADACRVPAGPATCRADGGHARGNRPCCARALRPVPAVSCTHPPLSALSDADYFYSV